jgi:quercetin dioxygenase-like cupin family protein
MDKKKVINRFLYSTKEFAHSTDSLYSPHTEWPKLPFHYLKLPAKYSFDLDRLRSQFNEIAGTQKLSPILTGESGKRRTRYQGIGLTHRSGSTNPLYDAIEWHGKDGEYNSTTVHVGRDALPKYDHLIKHNGDRDFTERNSLCSGYLQSILDQFSSPITKARFAEMKPGGFLTPHFDAPYYEQIRVHAALFTNPEVWWEVEGDRFQIPADGHFYFFDAGKVHSVSNQGSESRVVLTVQLSVYRNRDGSFRHTAPCPRLEELISQGFV